MTTNIPTGAYFRFRYRGEYDYGQVNGDGTYRLLNWTQVPIGTIVHNAVWKTDNHLQTRGTYKHKGKRKNDRDTLKI